MASWLKRTNNTEFTVQISMLVYYLVEMYIMIHIDQGQVLCHENIFIIKKKKNSNKH